jgi:hypothetical protein
MPWEANMSADYLAYYDYDRDAPLTCPGCGWTGCASGHEDLHDDLLDVCCPECGCMILVVPFPTLAETRAAAAAGNLAAHEDLPSIEAQVRRSRRAEQSELAEAADLPDLDGDRLIIEWDFEEADDERWTILRHGTREIWRELAYYEGYSRFTEVFEILCTRYGSRLAEVRPTPASELYLYGDKLSAPQMIDDLNASLQPVTGT